jgi:phage shock protein PspC (stress-responsive transcriptional regulator)
MNETEQTYLARSRDDRYIGGVAAGLARYFKIDPALVRVAFAVSLVVGGAGVLAYLVLLVMVPVEGDPDTPVPPVSGGRRKVAIAGTVAVGILLLAASASGGSGTSWLFGFGPGVLFGIFLWVAVVSALLWSVRKARVGKEPAALPTAPKSPSPEVAGGFAASPTQIDPAAAALVTSPTGPAPHGDGHDEDDTSVLPEDDPDTEIRTGGRPAGLKPASPKPPKSSTPATLGRVMTWVAIGLTGLLVLSILSLISFAMTALFGAIPAAVLVICCGVAVVWLALADRPQLALWATAAAMFVAIPMATVSIASLDIEGDWGDVQEKPVAASEIPAEGYKLAAGALKIDLRDFPFRKGETLDLETGSGFGATSVIVPDDVCVVGEVEGRIGYVYGRGLDWSGVEVEADLPQPAPDVPVLRLDSEFRIGYFGVFDDSGWRGAGDDWPDDLEERNRQAARDRAAAACEGKSKVKPRARSRAA